MRRLTKHADMSDADIAGIEIIVENDLGKFEDRIIAQYQPPEPKP